MGYNQNNKIKYAFIPKDGEGWIDVKDYKPKPFELVELKTINRFFQGWFTGTCWDGRKKKSNDIIIAWRK